MFYAREFWKSGSPEEAWQFTILLTAFLTALHSFAIRLFLFVGEIIATFCWDMTCYRHQIVHAENNRRCNISLYFVFSIGFPFCSSFCGCSVGRCSYDWKIITGNSAVRCVLREKWLTGARARAHTRRERERERVPVFILLCSRSLISSIAYLVTLSQVIRAARIPPDQS